MTDKERISARTRLAARALAGIAVAVSIAFVGALSADGAPGNDNWANAITLATPEGSTSGTNVEATVELNETVALSTGVSTTQTVWWEWVAPSTDPVTFAVTGAGTFLTIAVWTGSGHPLTEVAADDDATLGLESRVFFTPAAGTTYYVQVGSYPGFPGGAIDLEWGPSAVANDAFADATPLGADVGTLLAWNVGATVESPDEPNPFGDLGNTVWYSWTPATDGRSILVIDADFNRPTLAVYTGSTLATLDEVASDVSAEVPFDAVAGTTYYIQVGGNDTSPGTFLLGWALLPRPANDDLADAWDLVGGSATDSGTTTAATLEDTESTDVVFTNFGPQVGSQSVWYRWNPGATGEVVVSVVASLLDDVSHAPLVKLYLGPALDPSFGDLVPLGTHDDLSVTDRTDTLHARVASGATYYIQVMSDDTTGLDPDFDFTLTATFDNDLFANATVLEGTDGTISGTTAGATYPEVGELDPTGGDIDNTVWYAVTAPADGPATISISADFFAAAAVYTGSLVDGLVSIQDDYDGTDLTLPFNAVAGTTYYVQVGTYFDLPGPFELSWHLQAAAPGNDNFVDATPISDDTGSTDGSNVNATNEVGEPLDLPAVDGQVTTGLTVWWKWVAPASGRYVFDTFGSTFDTVLGVFTGSSVDALTLAVANDDAGAGTQSRVVFDATLGTTYYFQVGGFGGNRSGAIKLNWAANPLANDDFADATPLDGDNGSLEDLNVGATLEPGEPDPEDFLGHTVWYSWTPSTDGDAKLTFASSYLASLAIYTGDALGNLELVRYDNDNEDLSVDVRLRGGTTYYVQVGTYDDNPDFFTLGWSLVPRPANDDFADAAVLDGDSGELLATTVGATFQSADGEPDQFDVTGNTIWYAWTPSVTGAASVGMEAGFDPTLVVYTGTALGNLEVVGFDARPGGAVAYFAAAAGTTYYVQVGTYDDSPGLFGLAWSVTGGQHYVVTTSADFADDANCQIASCTLRQAVNAAGAGGGTDEIEVPAGAYHLLESLGPLVVRAGMTITGAGALPTQVYGPTVANRSVGGDRVFEIESGVGPVVIESILLRGGSANTNNGCFGGNVLNAGDLTLREVWITDGAACSGGGVSNAGGTLLVERSTFSGNQALFGGGDSGAIQNWGNGVSHGAVTIRNSTIIANTARLGGGVFSWNDAANTVRIENSTISFNTATNRGLGGIGGDGTFTVGSTIVSGNTFNGSPSNCSGTFVSLGSNLESGADCGFTAGGDQQNTDPQLEGLGDNGGPTATSALRATSPAVDAVTTECPTPDTDQRGIARPQGAACDIGAFELVPSAPVNDDFDNSIALAGPTTSTAGTTRLATIQAPDEQTVVDVAGSNRTGSHSVWYAWTPGVIGTAVVSVTPDIEPGIPHTALIQVYEGLSLAGLEAWGTHTARDTVQFDIDATTTTYYIQVMSDVGSEDNPNFDFTLDADMLPPANDDWANAEPLSGGNGRWPYGGNVHATTEPGEPLSLVVGGGAVPTGKTVWFSWVAPSSGAFEFDTVDSGFDTTLAVYTGASLAALEQVVADNDSGGDLTSRVVFQAEAGATYYVQLGSLGGEQEGAVVLNWSPVGPENDDFANAESLQGDSGSIDGSNVGATTEDGETSPFDGIGPGLIDNSVWYAWTPTAAGDATFELDAGFNGSVAVYTGSSLDALTFVGGAHNGRLLDFGFAVDGGVTYVFQVTSYDDDPGAFSLGWGLGPSRPANDDLTDAISVTGASGTIDGNTRNATTEETEPTIVDVGGNRTGSHSVWYRWTPGQSGESVISVAAHPELGVPHEPLIQLYQGSATPTFDVLDPVGTHDSRTAVRAVVDGSATYYIQVMSDVISETNPDFDFTLTWAAVREISGSVRTAGGATVPDVLVRACLGAACEDTTTNSDGFYAFSDIDPGAYVVRALPVDPALLAVQADADVTLESVQGLDLRLIASGASSTEDGPSSFRVTGCEGGSLHFVATGDGTVFGSGDVTDGAGGSPIDGVYTIDVSSLGIGHVATLRLDITITCALGPPEIQTALLFTDPSGTVVDDAAGGAALPGATVTLLDAGGTAIPAGDPRLSPATSANPETSDVRGAWAWDVAPGTYFVRAQKTDCGTTTSGALVVTPANPVTNVVLHLSCATAPTPPPFTPPANPPPSNLPDPVQGVNFNVVPISGTVLVNGAVLPAGQQIPFGAIIDATNGVVSITTIGPDGKVQTAYFFGGVFQLLLDPDGVTNLALRGGDFTDCPATENSSKKAKKNGTIDRRVQGALGGKVVLKKQAKKIVRSLWGSGKGKFRTSGRFSSATVRGTLWFTADRCDGTLTRVTQGSVVVLDFARQSQVTVHAWHPVLVTPG